MSEGTNAKLNPPAKELYAKPYTNDRENITPNGSCPRRTFAEVGDPRRTKHLRPSSASPMGIIKHKLDNRHGAKCPPAVFRRPEAVRRDRRGDTAPRAGGRAHTGAMR